MAFHQQRQRPGGKLWVRANRWTSPPPKAATPHSAHSLMGAFGPYSSLSFIFPFFILSFFPFFSFIVIFFIYSFSFCLSFSSFFFLLGFSKFSSRCKQDGAKLLFFVSLTLIGIMATHMISISIQ